VTQHPDQHGLDLFDETASAVRGFPNAMLGYDKKSVDDYVRDIEQQLSVAKHQLREVQRELTAANLRVDDTDFAKLGSHTASMLQVAEAQASEILQKALTRAEAVVADARAAADSTRSQAAQAVEDARLAGLASIKGLREDLERQTASELEAAKAEAQGLRQAADQHREVLMADAQRQADALLAQAGAEAERVRQSAEREAAELRARIAAERDEALTALGTETTSLRDQIAGLMADARTQSEGYQTTLAAAADQLRGRQQAAYAEAEQIKSDSIAEAQAILAKAKADADALLSESEAELVRRKEKLRRDAHLLRERKAALISQLNQLSSIANVAADEFPDEVTGPIDLTAHIPQEILDEPVIDETAIDFGAELPGESERS